MDFTGLLQEKQCICGKTHKCNIQHIAIGAGVISRLPEFSAAYHHILLVADNNTYEVCGKNAAWLLADRLEKTFVYRREGILIPDEIAVEEMTAQLTEDTDLIVGVGSGVIQDLCKYVSYEKGLPYYIIATAPSMDGYASVGAAMIMENMKVTYTCHVPQVIIGDVDVLKDAPMEMIQSGYGDILGKYSCLNDWKLSHLVNGEYFCQYVHDLMMEMVKKTQSLGGRLLQRDPEAVGILMEALAGAGVAMAMVGNSRPASGSEHHMSHYFEITGIVHNAPYLMHGTDVFYSAVYTQRLREKLLQNKELPAKREFDRLVWEKEIRRIYGTAAEGVIALQDKLGWYGQDRYNSYCIRWKKILDVLAQPPSSERLLGYVESIGLNIEDYDKFYGQAKIQDGIAYAKDLKDRYTVLWMYNDFQI